MNNRTDHNFSIAVEKVVHKTLKLLLDLVSRDVLSYGKYGSGSCVSAPR